MDLIDRDELRMIVYDTGRCNGKTALAKAISTIINNAPAVDAIPFKWTPCSERLPEEIGTYLVTINYHGYIYVCMDNFHPSGWGWDAIGLTRLAWAKVPDPYKGET